MKQTTRLRRLGPWLSVKRIKNLKKTHLGPIRRASGIVWALFPLRGPVLAFVDLRWPSLAVVGWKPPTSHLVLGSPVQSGFLAFLAKTGTETGPSKLIHLGKLDRDRKRPQNQSLRSFCGL